MKNFISWNGYSICRWIVAVVDGNIIGEFDSITEAKREMKGSSCKFLYAVAEEINKDGDINPPVYGDTLKEAMDRIKNIL